MTHRTRTALRGPDRLETRLAPAVTIVSAATARFTDVDGDVATITVSAGTVTAPLSGHRRSPGPPGSRPHAPVQSTLATISRS